MVLAPCDSVNRYGLAAQNSSLMMSQCSSTIWVNGLSLAFFFFFGLEVSDVNDSSAWLSAVDSDGGASGTGI